MIGLDELESDWTPPDPGEGEGYALAADLVGQSGVRALSRDSGVSRPSIDRLIRGDGVSLRNLAALTAVRPALVIYVGGAPYRLVAADEVPLAPELSAELESLARDGGKVLEGPRDVVCRLEQECADCGAEIAPGETSRNTAHVDASRGLHTRHVCLYCAGTLAGQNPGRGAWRRSGMISGVES